MVTEALALRTLGAARLLALLLALFLAVGSAVAPAWALSAADLPPSLPQDRVLDSAGVLSRASRAEIEALLQEFSTERVEARLVTVDRLDYGLSLNELGRQLVEGWSVPQAGAPAPASPVLLLLIDAKTKATAVEIGSPLERQLPASLLRSTARTTMALPLRSGDRYRQAIVDGLARLSTVLRGGEDPGEPVVQEAPVIASNVPSQEETASSNAFTWVVVLLVVGSIVPMLTWWVFSR